MGADTPTPIGAAETKAFNVFMKKYMKNHLHQDEDECNWNGTNAWGKLTRAQKKLFAIKPKVYATKRRPPIQKKKRPPKSKAKPKILGRSANPHGNKLAKKLAKQLAKKLEKRENFDSTEY